MTPNLAPIALLLLLLLLLPWPQPAGAVSPRLLQECPGPPANGSLLLGNPPVKVTLGYLTAVTGTMNNRQVGVNNFVFFDSSLSFIYLKVDLVKRQSRVTTILLTALPGATSKILLSYPKINQGTCTSCQKRNHKVFGPKQFDHPIFYDSST